jgi:hypothetical protein
MSEIIRDTFIALHSSDVLSKLDEEVIFLVHITSHRLMVSAVPDTLRESQNPDKLPQE